jgi:alpha-beta hydrolase superfamily lysophospholipase
MTQAPEAAAVVREELWFTGASGLRLFARSWRPAGVARAVIVLVHGYAEHSGRYDHVGETLARAGYAVHAYDQRGHGRSEGERALVRSIDEYLDDLDLCVARMREAEGRLPLFIVGHSMGGGIVALHAIERRPGVRGVVLSGAAVMGGESRGIRARILLALSRFLPKLPLVKLDAASVSRDPEVVRLYDADPLNYRGRMKLGLAASMMRAGQRIARGLHSLDVPLLIMHGTKDSLVASSASVRLHDGAASTDKTLLLYDGLYHEIFNEPERDRVLGDVVRWMGERC